MKDYPPGQSGIDGGGFKTVAEKVVGDKQASLFLMYLNFESECLFCPSNAYTHTHTHTFGIHTFGIFGVTFYSSVTCLFLCPNVFTS